MTRDSAIALLSGGLDSAVALWWAKKRWNTYALTFKYGKLNSNEVRSAKRLAKKARVTHHFVVNVAFLKQISELRKRLTSQGLDLKSFPPTYVPGRNTIFLGIAAHYAEIYDAAYIVTGHIGRDPFPDSKPAYVRAMNNALSKGGWLRKKHAIRILTPFERSTKQDVVRLAMKLQVPLELTWSCHRNRKRPCAKCSGCLDRSRALKMSSFVARK
ncbi:MAG TPA: 7-cyano-7-deazaguanine synthase QueC [Candidatus Acidoferrum sp.]|nr:7-cyano-7-deazaguanine synthase QueC [Candidatus Acidoferrum sp.]